MNVDRSTWKRVRFGDLVENINEYFDVHRDGVLPYVAGPHITSGDAFVTEYGSTDDDTFPPTFKRKFRDEDVLLHSRGIEKLASVDRAGVTGEKLFVLRSKDPSVLAQPFLVWLLRSSTAAAHMRDNFTGSVNRFLNWGPLSKFEFDLPPLDQQQRIADLLWAAERHQQAMRVQVEASRSALRLQRARLVNDPMAQAVKAADAFEFSTGVRRTPDRAAGPHMTPYLRSANVGYGELDLTNVLEMNYEPNEQRKFALRFGDVLVTEGSASASAVGMPARWCDEIPGPVCFQMTLLRLRAIVNVCLPEFVFHWSMWAYESGRFLEVAGGTNIKHVSALRSSQMVVHLPTLEEQRNIIAALESMTEGVRAMEVEMAALGQVRRTLLSEIFGGTS